MADKHDETIRKIVEGIKELLEEQQLAMPIMFLIKADVISDLIVTARSVISELDGGRVKRRFIDAMITMIKDMDPITAEDCEKISMGLKFAEQLEGMEQAWKVYDSL